MAQINEAFLFNPLSIPGCELWFDASDLSTISSTGSALGTWSNKGTSTGVNITGTSGTPRTGIDRQNGLNCISLTIGDVLVFTTSFPTAPRTRFFATLPKVDTSSSSIVLLWQGGSSMNGYDYIGLEGSSGALEVAQGAIVTLQTTAMPNHQGTFYVYTFRNATTTANNRIAFTGTEQALITNEVAQQYFSGTVATYINSSGAQLMGEFLSYNRELTQTETLQIEGYLAWKWGVQSNLPSTHPFKNYRPLANAPFPTTGIPPMPTVTQNVNVFLPTQISNCALWFDAADTTTITGTSQVTAWRNKGSISVTATNRTGSCTSGNILPNGLNYISCPVGTDLGFTCALNTQARTWIIVARNTTQLNVSPTNYWGPINQTAGAGQEAFVFVRVGASDYRGYIGPAGIAITVEGQFQANPLNQISIYSVTNSTNSAENNFTLTGAPLVLTNSSTAANFNTNSLLYVINTAVYNTGGDYFEILFYTRALTTVERQQIEGYLAWKWSLTASLPPNHPYKTPPLAPFPFRTTAFRGSLNSWQPTILPNCQLWLDAADINTVTTSGSSVVQWRDKSGNNNNTTSFGSATYNRSGLNGLPCLSNITNGTGPITSPGTPNISVFVVASVPSLSASYDNVLALNATSLATAAANFYAAGNMFVAYYGGQSPPPIYGYIGAGNMSLSYVGVFGQPMIWEGTQAGSITSTWGNGTQYDSTTVSATNLSYTAYWIGGPFTSGGPPPWRGFVGEIIIYNRTVNTRERQQVEGYLAWKWGQQGSLPANHPFIRWPPSPS